jgi:hypothetical protein
MKALKLLCYGVLPTALLGGCFDDSSSGPASATSTRISYQGVTGPASLSAANAAVLLSGAYQGGQTGTAFGSAASTLTGSDGRPGQPRLVLLSQVLAGIIRQADFSRPLGASAAVSDVNNQLAGNCGGQMAYTGTADDASRQFYATFTFTDYCQDGTTFSGSATASGQTDTTLGFSSLSLSFDALTVAALGDAFTANGYEIITPGSGSFNVKMNMLLQDNATRRVFRFDQLLFIVEQGSGFVDLGITGGRYYDPRYGYIDLSTPTFPVIAAGDYWPSSGIIAGTGFNSSARFTAQSDTVYQLDVDSNGDGTTDFTTTGLWSGL